MPHTTHYQLAALTDADLRALIDAAEAELADRHASREAERRWQTVLPLDRADAELASDGLADLLRIAGPLLADAVLRGPDAPITGKE